MPHLENCKTILRKLIAKGDAKCIPLAERAINDYLEATPAAARKSGLPPIQLDVLAQSEAVLGALHNFAEAVNAYIEKKLTEE